jgi:hypothetical protein
MVHDAIDPTAVGDWLGNAKTALGVLKAARGLLPSGPSRAELDANIGRAEDALARSDAALAKQLGYQLCHCRFPPQIMLWREAEGVLACPDSGCGRTLRPARAAAAKPVPVARICPLCEGEMKVDSEMPHPDFDFAGMKVHAMTCSACGNKATRNFTPGKGYD